MDIHKRKDNFKVWAWITNIKKKIWKEAPLRPSSFSRWEMTRREIPGLSLKVNRSGAGRCLEKTSGIYIFTDNNIYTLSEGRTYYLSLKIKFKFYFFSLNNKSTENSMSCGLFWGVIIPFLLLVGVSLFKRRLSSQERFFSFTPTERGDSFVKRKKKSSTLWNKRTTMGFLPQMAFLWIAQVKINQIVPPGTNGARIVVKSKNIYTVKRWRKQGHLKLYRNVLFK